MEQVEFIMVKNNTIPDCNDLINEGKSELNQKIEQLKKLM